MSRLPSRLFALSVVVAAVMDAHPSRAGDEDIMVAVDALNGLGFSCACASHIQGSDKPDVEKIFKETLEALNSDFRRIYGVSLSSISIRKMHRKPESYITAAETEMMSHSMNSEQLRNFCLKSVARFSSFIDKLSKMDSQSSLNVSRPSDSTVVISCSGKTVVMGEGGVVKSTRSWDSVVLRIDPIAMTVRHDDEPTGPRLTKVSNTHYTWYENATLITEGSFNRLNGTGEERLTMQTPGFLAKNFYERCELAPKPRF